MAAGVHPWQNLRKTLGFELTHPLEKLWVNLRVAPGRCSLAGQMKGVGPRRDGSSVSSQGQLVWDLALTQQLSCKAAATCGGLICQTAQELQA